MSPALPFGGHGDSGYGRSTRFVATHLLVLMLFEADTYGYRLVMPMYAPMVVVAAQVPLAVVRALMAWRAGAGLGGLRSPRALRYAEYGWAVVALGALVWQCKALSDAWPDREVALHGLGRTGRAGGDDGRSGWGQAIYSRRSTARPVVSALAVCPACATRGSSGSIRRGRCPCRRPAVARCTCCPS